MIGTVGQVTVETVLAHRCMLEQKGPTLLRMTSIAGLIYRIGLQQFVADAAVRIMAIDAAEFAFQQGHMGATPKLRSLLLMTAETGFVDTAPCQQALGRERCHRVMAITAADVVSLVHRTYPVDSIPALMTLQTYGVECADGRGGGMRKANDARPFQGILYMYRAGSVTGLTSPRCDRIAGILQKHFGVRRMGPVRHGDSVAGDTFFHTDVLPALKIR